MGISQKSLEDFEQLDDCCVVSGKVILVTLRMILIQILVSVTFLEFRFLLIISMMYIEMLYFIRSNI